MFLLKQWHLPMSDPLQVWRFIANGIEQHIPVMILYVVESKGSSPGRQGFFLAVNNKGEMKGSIGGGIMEHKFVEMALQKLNQNTNGMPSAAIKKQVHDKSVAKDQSGMICSGEQTIVMYQAGEKDLPHLKNIISALENKHPIILQLTQGSISTVDERLDSLFYFQQGENEWVYKEKIGLQYKINIIGGGHCALALSRLMRMLGFYIRVYDNRPGLNTFTQNEFADETILLDGYESLSKIKDDPAAFVVIMTFGYRSDDIALRSLIQKQFRYIGLLGSKTKIEKMFS